MKRNRHKQLIQLNIKIEKRILCILRFYLAQYVVYGVITTMMFPVIYKCFAFRHDTHDAVQLRARRRAPVVLQLHGDFNHRAKIVIYT